MPNQNTKQMFPVPPSKRGLSQSKPTERLLPKQLPKWATEVAHQSGQSLALVRSAIDGVNNQLREVVKINPPYATALVQEEINRIADSYGARKEINRTVLSECTQLVLTKFVGLRAEEIREAYRMKAAGELEVGGEGVMWGGVFDANQLGAVLSAYIGHRQKALRAFSDLKEKREKEAAIAKKQEAFEKEFPKTIEKLKEKAESWMDCPEWIYDSARARGMITFKPGEAQEIFEQAMQTAKAEAQAEHEEGKKGGRNLFQLKELEKAMGESEVGSRAQVIARKMSVYRKLCNKI